MKPSSTLAMRWERDVHSLDEVVAFFVANVSTAYISHGEVLGGRATDFSHWSPELATVLKTEIERCCEADALHRLVLARDSDVLVGIAVVEVVPRRSGALAVLEDMVVSTDRRSAGVGNHLLHWIETELAGEGVTTMILESGARNTLAHRFFERHGYSVASVVMTKSL